MTSLKNRILTVLEGMRLEEIESFKWQLQEPENLSGCKPLTKCQLQVADTKEKVVDLIIQNFPGRELEIMDKILTIVRRGDLVGASGLACSMGEPACSMEEPACSMREPACSMEEPACSMREPACSMEEPACSMEEPACSMEEPACSMREPVCLIESDSKGSLRVVPSALTFQQMLRSNWKRSMEEPACSMREPVCLIESDSKGSLRVVPSALKTLQQIEQKVVVVSVVGLYRTGKSFLMNRLAGVNKGFPLGSTVQSKTKGIWMWCVPHPRKADHTLVLLDTEGLGDVEKGDTKNDNWIFSMAVLLSSTLVYNSMGTIDNKSMENLHYVTELTKNIKMKSNAEKDDERTIVRYLPSFVWAVRDFTLDLKLDETPCTEDEYLEHSLKEIQGGKPQYNEPRACLRKFFQPRHCFVFDRPASRKTMKRMEESTDAELDPDFVEQANKFTEHIYTKSDTKFVGDGIKVTGRMLGQLAVTYVEAIRSGEVPCLENAVVSLAVVENAKAVELARLLYVQCMTSVRFPTKTMEELSAIHASSEREARSLFMKHSFRDDNQEYQKKLVTALQGEYNQISEENIKESRKACEQIIKQVFKPLEDNVGAGLYSVPGGYTTFWKDLTMMTVTYRRAEGRGVMAEEVLKTYLDVKATVGTAILAADRKLSTAQRRAEEDKAKWQRERLASEEKQKALEEHNKQLNDKMEEYAKDADDKLMAAEELLKTCLDEKETISADILAADKRLSEAQRRADEAQRRADEDKAKWEKAERKRLSGKEKRKTLEVEVAQQRKTHEEDIKQLNDKMEKYKKDADDKRMAAEELLKTCLDEKETISADILAADKRLSEAQRRPDEAQRRADEDKAKWEKAERKRLSGKEKRKTLEVEVAQQRKTHEEDIKQLNDKMEKYKKDADDKRMAAEELLKTCLDEKETISADILAADKRLSEAQRRPDEAQRRADEDKAKWEKAERKRLKQKLKAVEVEIKQLNDKMEKYKKDADDKHPKRMAAEGERKTYQDEQAAVGTDILAADKRLPEAQRRAEVGASNPAPGTTNRRDLLKYASPLSLDSNTANRYLILSENNRRVTRTDVRQAYADHADRFKFHNNVLSRESLSGPSYFEVEWSGEYVGIAVCQDDVHRDDVGLSDFRCSNRSWALYYCDGNGRYRFYHNSIEPEVSGPVPSTGGSHRVGVYVDPPASVLCFYDVCGNTMSLLHKKRTTFTRPLYAGIFVHEGTAEVCEIW